MSQVIQLSKVYRFSPNSFQLQIISEHSNPPKSVVSIPVNCNGKEEIHFWEFSCSYTNVIKYDPFNRNPHTYKISISGKHSHNLQYEIGLYKIVIRNHNALLVQEKGDLIGHNYNHFEFTKDIEGYQLQNAIVDITLQSYDIETPSNVSLKTMLDRGRLTDMIIKTKGKDFPCHKVVLATASDYFDKMFEVDMKEKNESVINWVNVVDSATVQDLLHFIYTGQTPPNIQNTCLTLLETAHMCLMNDLKIMCANKLKNAITLQNMGVILRVAVKNECEGLQEVVVNFIVKNYDLNKGDSPPPWDKLEPEFGKSLAITMLKSMITKKISL